MTRLSIVAFAAIVAQIGVAHADKQGGGWNAGEEITLEQLQSRKPDITAEQFAKADADGNGLLSRSEVRAAFRKGARGRAAERLKAADSNGDGAISLEEAQQQSAKKTAERFSRHDSNGDGLLDASELEAILERRRGERRHGRRGRGHLGAAKFDADDSGGVSFAEFQAQDSRMTAERFAELDVDADGELNRGEIRAGSRAGRRDR